MSVRQAFVIAPLMAASSVAMASGLPPLMDAAYKCRPEVVFDLLKQGNNPKQRDKYGKTALEWAATRGCGEAQSLLARAGSTDFERWRQIQKAGERFLAESSSRQLPHENMINTKGAVPRAFKNLAETEIAQVDFPGGLEPQTVAWQVGDGEPGSVIVQVSFVTKSSGTAPIYNCGFTLMGGGDKNPPVLIAQNKCVPTWGDEMLGEMVKPIASVDLPGIGKAVLFQWFGEEESGRWLYFNGGRGWERIAHTMDFAD